MLGIDAAAEAIGVARRHASEWGVAVTYRVATAEEVAAEGDKFDAVTALEVIEHVPDPPAFVRTLAGLLRPGGKLFVSTINRTARSFAVAIVGAEYVARLLPAGTHDWRRFVTPAELAAGDARRRAAAVGHGRNGAGLSSRRLAGKPGLGGELHFYGGRTTD